MDLNNSVNFHNILFNEGNDIVVCCDLNYDIYEFNSAAEKYFTCKKEDVLGKNYITFCETYGFEIISPNEKKLLSIQKNIHTKVKFINNHGVENILCWKIVILLDVKAKEVGIIFIGNNISTITEENYMRNFFFYLEKISSSLPGHFYWKDREGHYLGCSEDLLRSANLSRQEVIGKDDFALWPELAEAIIGNDQETIKQNRLLTFKEEINLPNGKKQYFIAMKTPLKDYNGRIIGVIGNSIDITERIKIQEELSKEKAELERVNHIKDEFLFNMKHDLRTPFTGILGFASILEEKETDLEKKEGMANIKKAAQALLNVLNEIFEYLQLNTEQKPLLFKSISLKDIIQSTSNMFIVSLKEKNLAFNIEYDEKIPKLLLGDKLSIVRILVNLLGNAIKFTSHGHVTLKVELAKQIERQVIIKFIVEDTGAGIPSDKYDFIFEKFSRVVPSYKGLYEGLGLGLSFVKQIIDDLEGEIKVQSKLNVGSTFTCIIPFKLPLLADDDANDSRL